MGYGLRPSVDHARVILQGILSRLGRPTYVTSGRRTHEQQAALYRDWQAGTRRLPAAPPGRSAHEYGLAFDLGGAPRTLRIAGALAPYLGLTWGGRFHTPDVVHFEL